MASAGARMLPIQQSSLRACPHHGRHLVQHGQYLLHAALVEHRDLHTLANQRAGDVGLQVGKAEHAVGSSARILSIFALRKALTRGLLLRGARRGRTV